jgi:sugar/nucleoside kinase (ribokinase family)
MLGGAATYISLAAAYFTPVKLLAVVGDDFAQQDVDLFVSRQIDLAGLERISGGKTFFWAGVYSSDMNDRTTLRTDLNVFADFNPKLPQAYRTAPYLLLGNIQPELQKSVRAQMNGLRLVGGDTMNYWIKDFRSELLATIREWDFLLINDSEAHMLSGEHVLRTAAAKILDMGPHTLVIKRGEYGAVLFRRENGAIRHFIAPGYLLEEVFDPTGAGDCFAGGFIGYLAGCGAQVRDGDLDFAELRRAVIYGSVMGSFCCEQFGVDRFRTLTRTEIDERYQEFQSCTVF